MTTWKKTLGATVAIAAAVLLLLAGAAYRIVHGVAFSRWVRQKAIQEAEKATGSRVDIQRIDIHWSQLGVDFYGLVIYGNGASSLGPFLRADHVGVGLKIISVLQRKIDLSELILDRPFLNLQLSTKGETNLPKAPRSRGSKSPLDTVFDLAVGHLAVHSGQIHYNDRQIPLLADLRDFHADAVYHLLSDTYSGSLGYDRGRIVARDFTPVEHGLRLKFVASRSELELDPLSVSFGKSHITARGKLVDYNQASVEGSYEAMLFTPELASILKNKSLPQGEVAASGSLRYQASPHESFLQAVDLNGRFSSPVLGFRAGQILTEAKSVRGAFSLGKSNLRLLHLEADLLRGHLTANAEMLNIADQPTGRVNASVQNLSLEEIGAVLPQGSYGRLRLAGLANVDLQASWPGRLRDIAAHAQVSIAGPPASPKAPGALAVNGSLDVRYDGAREAASFGPSRLQTGRTQISFSGTLSKQSSLTVQASSSDLRELSALVSEVRAATAAAPAAAPSAPLDIQGSAQFSGQVSGAARNPRIQGQLLATQLELEGNRWRSIRTDVDLSASGASLRNGAIEDTQQGRLAFNARTALTDWAFRPSSQLFLQASAKNLRLVDLERIAKQRYPLAGMVSANISVQGSEQNPSGHGSVQIDQASAWGEPINSLAVNLQASGTSLQVSAQLQAPAGNVTANISFAPQSKQYDVRVSAAGVKLDQIHAIAARNLRMAGVVAMAASGRGTLQDPQLSGHLIISKFQLRDQSISSAEAQIEVARQHANFSLHSVIAQGQVEASGEVALSGAYTTSASINVRALPVGPLLASYLSASAPGLQGQTEIHAEFQGPLKDPASIQAHIQIPTLDLSYLSTSIALATPLRLDYAAGVATLQPTELKGTGTDITLHGVIPIRDASSSFHIGASGGLDLSLVQGLSKSVKSSGRVELQLEAGGKFRQPSVQGQIKIENVYLSTELLPVGIEGINGELDIAGNRLEVSKLAGNLGGGTVSANGFVAYSREPVFNLGVQAKSVRLRYPEGLRSILDANLQLNGDSSNSNLSGQVLIDRLSFTDRFDLANFTSPLVSGSSPSSLIPLEQNMRLRVTLQSAQDLSLASSQLSMQGAANLKLVGTLAAPVVLGRVDLSGGDIFFLGKRYEIQSGAIEFSNPVQSEPVVNLYIKTTVQQYNITLNLIGPVDRLRTNYTSDPALPPADIINLLAAGVTAARSATTPAPASVSAESVVAQGVAGQVSGKIQKFAGISQLTIDPLANNNTANPGSQISIQQRVTGNILLTFGTDVTSTQATSVQLQYRTTPQTSVSILRDQNGGYAIDFRIHKTF
jgi:translocation and assembly module TamB